MPYGPEGQDAKLAKVRILAQSGDGNRAKDLVLKRSNRFLFVVVSRQTKKQILCVLCVSAVNNCLR